MLTAIARKSQIAIEYAYRLRRKSPNISTFWVHASDKNRFQQSYAEIAIKAGISVRRDSGIDTLRLVSDWLEDKEHGSWLLILDNADDRDIFFDLQQRVVGADIPAVERRLIEFVPQVKHGTVLITTRDRSAALKLTQDYSTPVEVEPMSQVESIDLLRNKIQDAALGDAVDLVDELEHIPLAISHAGAYIRENSALVTIHIYLSEFRKSRDSQASLLNSGRSDLRRDGGVPNAVITSFELSFVQIRRISPKAADLLSLMSFFSRQAIPQFLIQESDSFVAFCQTMEPLLSFSLVRAEINEQTFEMHRLVQTAMRHWIEMEGTSQMWRERAIAAINYPFPNPHNSAKWAVCKTLFSHAEEALLHKPESQDAQMRYASLIERTAQYLVVKRVDYQLAEERQNLALQLRKQHMDDDAKDILDTMSGLAYIYRKQLRYSEAEEICIRILETKTRVLGSEHPNTLASMSNLASTYQKMRKYGMAEALYDRTLELRRQHLGSESPMTLRTLLLSARNKHSQSKYKEAETLYALTLEKMMKIHGPEDPDTMLVMDGLAVTYLQQGKLEAAERLALQSFQLSAKVLGPDDKATLASMGHLAQIYHEQKKLEKAEDICKQCLNLSESFYGLQHAETTRKLQLLGWIIYEDGGRTPEAMKIFADAVERRKNHNGPGHEDTSNSMYALALCLNQQGDNDQAIELMADVLGAETKRLGPDHPETMIFVKYLARWQNERRESTDSAIDVENGLGLTENKGLKPIT